ncbi:hypothetical protein C475_19623 [Halosimplex carlsbadense 2-9-1]|uniref:Uncharacterized protein n=1 Tax=Halosimplex carlsbadense 2-9-1 TaxID=797114 RepID=M0CEQ1_9EURY|nr:hypothetical protein C475_19623 [Halosimplex carlsbadense 2-9-1]
MISCIAGDLGCVPRVRDFKSLIRLIERFDLYDLHLQTTLVVRLEDDEVGPTVGISEVQPTSRPWVVD